MSDLPLSIKDRLAMVPMPDRIARLPRDLRGMPIPKFVVIRPDGTPDFRVASQFFAIQAKKRNLCWICGETLGRNLSFIGGPLLAINRQSAEPPSHRACAEYAIQICPFMFDARSHRNAKDLPKGTITPNGLTEENPGCCVIWTTKSYQSNRDLMEVGEPIDVSFFVHGRPATREEIGAALKQSFTRIIRTIDEQCKDHRTRARQLFLAQEALAHCIPLCLPMMEPRSYAQKQ